MNTEDRIKVLEDELKVLKNELRAMLLDMREQYLNIQDPFNFVAASNPGGTQAVITEEQTDKQVKSEVPGSGNDSDKQVKSEVPGLGNDSGNALLGAGATAGRTSETGLSGEVKEEEPDRPQPGAEMLVRRNADVANVGVSQRPGVNHKPHTERKLGKWQEDEAEDEKQPKRAVSRDRRKADKGFAHGDSKADIVVIAGLTNWLDQATAKLGRERTEALVEMSSAIGRLSPDLKDALVRMARLSHHESNGQLPAASDYLSLLAQLDNLMGGSKLQDNALLSILSMMKENHSG